MSAGCLLLRRALQSRKLLSSKRTELAANVSSDVICNDISQGEIRLAAMIHGLG